MIMLCVSTVVEDCKNGRKMKTHGINMPSGILGEVFFLLVYYCMSKGIFLQYVTF